MADYTCYRTRTPMVVDGRLTEASWAKTPKSPRVVDMISGEPQWLGALGRPGGLLAAMYVLNAIPR